MGALPNTYPGYQDVASTESEKFFLKKSGGVQLNPNHGLRIPEMLDEALVGNVKVMYIMGEDPVLTDPDANHVKKALGNLEFLVVQDLF